MIRKFVYVGLCAVFISSLGEVASAPMTSNNQKKAVIIGMDGLDPVLVQKFIDSGDLPNFKKLALQGSFSSLGTSNPPQSPVAWACLASGTDPGEHDVFDFVIRNPGTYLPEIGMTENSKTSEGALKKIFSGLSGPGLQTRRKGKTFWDELSAKGVSSTLLRFPVTFPAQPLKGRLLSGMGVPDIRGTQGISTSFTTRNLIAKESRGRIVNVKWVDQKILTELTGPKVQGVSGSKDITVPLQITRLSEDKISLLLDGQSEELRVGQWSSWFRVKFKASLMNDIYGICRFHFNSLEPDFDLFATAVNIDPQAPAMPISYPSEYAKEIYEHIGNFYTQGMPYDTWALNEGRLTEEDFLGQAYSIFDDNMKSVRFELNRYESGVFFAYFGIADLIQHMFWRYIDNEHPNPGHNKNPEVQNAIKNVYVKMDEVLGEVQKKVDSNTLLIVLSDHGFGSFRRAVHLNSWLREYGFLTLKNNATIGDEFLANVDWQNTQAYSVGFGGIYINQFGREKQGIVYSGAETEDLKQELIKQLKKWKDTDGTLAIKEVYRNEDLYSGPYAGNGPDLFVGFNKNYRASWQTGLGAAPAPIVENNTRVWTGDHLCDPSLVPGVILSNKKLKVSGPNLMDLNNTILAFFGVTPEKSNKGRVLY